MTLQVLVFLLFACLSLSIANDIKRAKEPPSNSREVDVIYLPYEDRDEHRGNSSAVLSVDLKDLTDFTVCFKFMVDGLADVSHGAEIATFWHILASFFVPEQFYNCGLLNTFFCKISL